MVHKLRRLPLCLLLCFFLLPISVSAKSKEPAEEPEVTVPAPFTEEGGAYTRDLQYDAATNKQFITIETKAGNVFYLVIDYDKPLDDKGEQYHTYFLNKVDDGDLLALLDPESMPQECSCPDKCVAGAVDTACPVCAVNMTECVGIEPTRPPEPTQPIQVSPEEPQQELDSGKLLAVLVLLGLAIGVGAALLLRRKGSQTRGNTDLEEYDFGDEEYAEFDQYTGEETPCD